MNALRDSITAAAQSFADELFAALRGLSLDQLLETVEAPSPGVPSRKRGRPRATPPIPIGEANAPKRRIRRTSEDLARTADLIVKLLRAAPAGMTMEEIRAKLGLERQEVARPVAMLLADKKITKRGKKRATRYYAAK